MGNENLGLDVLRAIRRIVRRVADHSRALSRDSGVTVPQLLCMRALADSERGECTIAGISQAVQLAPATISGIVDRLERSGFVARVRGTTDRRKVWVRLTPRGAERLAAVRGAPLQERFLARLAELPEGEQRALLQALEQVVVLMEAERIDAAPMLTGEHRIDS